MTPAPEPTPARRAAWRCCGAALLAACALLGTGLAAAERADRTRPFVVEADRPGTVDYQRQVVVFAGNVVITQGSMVLRADRVEMRETAEGYRAATATGTPGRQASWRQKRDNGDETVEGSADRIEFDGRADTLRLVGHSVVRRLRAGVVADEISGAAIVWDNLAETARVEGGAPTAANPTGRVRVVLSPRVEAAASAPAPAASASAPTSPLAPARALGERR